MKKGFFKESRVKINFKFILEIFLFVLIFSGSLVFIFLLPLYQDYKKNQEVLGLKEALAQGKSEIMTEETYQNKRADLLEQSEKTKEKIPETMEITKIYEMLVDQAEMTGMELTFIEFQAPDFIPRKLIFEEDKTIENSEAFQKDQKLSDSEGNFLMRAKGSLKSIGDESSQVVFLEAIENHQPMIKIKRTQIKETEEGKQVLLLEIETYAFLK